MKKRLNASLITAGTALILLTGCVSSRKYKASQADLAKVRNDSAQLAQQVSTLNGNVKDLQDKNSNLQRSLDNANSQSAATQKSLDYYQGYFKDQQNSMNQVNDDIKNALTQAGISNADVQQTNNVVYVRLDENELFRKNSTTVTPGGKKALDGVAQVIKSRSNVNVFVGGGDSAAGNTAGNMGSMDNSTASAPPPPPAPRHHRSHPMNHAGSSSASSGGSSGTSGTSGGSNNSTASSGNNTSTPVHHKVHHHYSSEQGMVYSGPGAHNKSWALKEHRMVTVANSFLKNGVSKINVSMTQPPMGGTPDNTIKVVIMPKMEDFNPPANSSATR